jgi:hypothetical protein
MLRLRLRTASRFTVHGCAWVLPCVAEGEAWVISPEFLLSNFPAFLSLKTGSTLRSDKFQAVNGYKASNNMIFYQQLTALSTISD